MVRDMSRVLRSVVSFLSSYDLIILGSCGALDMELESFNV